MNTSPYNEYLKLKEQLILTFEEEDNLLKIAASNFKIRLNLKNRLSTRAIIERYFYEYL